MKEAMATASYNKPQPRKAGPFYAIRKQSHTVVIDEYGVPDKVSLHQMTAALGRESNPQVLGPGCARQSDSPQTMNDDKRQGNHWTSEDAGRERNPQMEYAEEKIVVHNGHGR